MIRGDYDVERIDAEGSLDVRYPFPSLPQMVATGLESEITTCVYGQCPGGYEAEGFDVTTILLPLDFPPLTERLSKSMATD